MLHRTVQKVVAHPKPEAAGVRTTYTWSVDNRQTKIELPGGAVVTNAYRADGLRRQKQDSAGTTRFVYDGQAYLAETDGSNVTQAVYTNEPNAYGGLVSQRRQSGALWLPSYYHFDAVGSTRGITGADQNFLAFYAQLAFGAQLAGGAAENPFRFVGRLGYYYDQASDSFQVRQRPYRADLARWLGQDREPDDHNLYRYVGNSPLRDVDPAGLWKFLGKNYVWPWHERASLNPLKSIVVMPVRQAGGEAVSLVTTGSTSPLSETADVSDAFILGTVQGGANTIAGVQDTAVGLLNLAGDISPLIHGAEYFFDVDLTVPSPDWSRDLFVHEGDRAHAISKFLGGEGVITLATAGAGLLRHVEKVRRVGSLRGLRLAPKSAGQLSPLSNAARKALEPGLERIGLMENLPIRRPLTLPVRASRAFVTGIKRHVPVEATAFGRFLKNAPIIRNLQWEQGHVFIQVRWFRAGGPTQWFPKNQASQLGLQRIGNAGWNLMPMPRAINKYLGRHPWASFGVGVGVAGGSAGVVGGSIYSGYQIGEYLFLEDDSDDGSEHQQSAILWYE